MRKVVLIVIKLDDEVYNGDKEDEGYVLFRANSAFGG